ncbi:MAG: hypothetical protein U9Q29_03125 [Campylobacterota bacterium]|nr:hypothetical protein [Campylobacterota bacterium]
MKKFNLFNEIIVTDRKSLLEAVNSSKLFGVLINGEVKYHPFDYNDIFIYMNTLPTEPKKELTEEEKEEESQKEEISIEDALGSKYQIVIDEDRVLIKAFSNWQELININTPRSSYDDTTADGVLEFSNASLEDIGWNATEFDISYRTLVEVLEKNCEGTILCIEQVEPYQFSGLGYLSDNQHAIKTLFEYCQQDIKKTIEEDEDFDGEDFTDEEMEAADFFEVKY